MKDVGGWRYYKNYKCYKAGKVENLGEQKVPLYRFGTHSLRRLWITEAARLTKEPFLVMQMVHHDKVETTMRYINEAQALEKRNLIIEELWGKQFFNGTTMKNLPKQQQKLKTYIK